MTIYDNLNGLTRLSPRGIGRPLRVAFDIRENAITTLAANCLDGGFEMLPVFHGLSPDGEMFASDRFTRGRPWKGHLPAHISRVRREGPSFLAIGPMDKNAQLHWIFRWSSYPVFNNSAFCVLWPSNAISAALRNVVPSRNRR